MLLRSFDFIFVCVVFGLSIWLWTVADGFPESRRFAQIDTDYWPKHVFAVLILVSGALLAQKLIGLWRARGTVGDRVQETAPGDRMAAVRIAAMLGFSQMACAPERRARRMCASCRKFGLQMLR